MDVHRNIWEEFFPGEAKEGNHEDVSQEWLSIYVEDCLSGSTNFTSQSLLSPPASTTSTHPPLPLLPPPQASKPPFPDLQFQAKSRNKRRKTTAQMTTQDTYDPPLLHQTQWLADSQLIFPKKDQDLVTEPLPKKLAAVDGEEEDLGQPRRCTHCLSQRTPQWRAGPLGPKTLCNACGVRYKSGRLLPEYRPAKSPTFVSYKHSNSHKKVMEMRNMAILSSSSS